MENANIRHNPLPLRSIAVAGCLAWLGLVVGCGQSYPLEGEVMFDGQPIKNGTIIFRPDETQGNSGPSATTRIVNGRFLVPAGQAVSPGPTVADITDTDRPNLRLVAHFDFPASPTEGFVIEAEQATESSE